MATIQTKEKRKKTKRFPKTIYVRDALPEYINAFQTLDQIYPGRGEMTVDIGVYELVRKVRVRVERTIDGEESAH